MEDGEIIELYHRRDERAIDQSDRKYGGFCRKLALDLLGVREDAEECVSDTWLAAWDRMPPDWPQSLRAFFGRIVRNLSISRFRRDRARKRYGGMEVLLSELAECIPGGDVDREVERHIIAETISRWLDGLPKEDRDLFVRRYWYGDQVKTLAAARGERPDRLAGRMRRLRESLRRALEQEGVDL